MEKIVNFRQLCSGSAKIYRSASPDDGTKQDVKYLQDALGIQMIIDFRQPDEVSSAEATAPLGAAYKRVPVTEEEIEDMKTKGTTGDMLVQEMPYVRCGLGFTSVKYNQLLGSITTDAQKDEMKQLQPSELGKYFMQNIINPRGLLQQYIDFCETSGTHIYTIFKLFCEPQNVPVLIHCTAGKDRTGITAALVQTCVGLPRDQVLEDYAASTEGLKAIYDELYEDYVNTRGMTEDFLSSTKETMATLLEHIDKKYGSVQKYLTNIGFGPEDQEKMKKNIMIS